MSWQKKLLFSFIPLVALCAAVEIGFRLFAQEANPTTVAGFVVPDPDLIWCLKRASSGPLATNGLGFRDGRYRARADVKILLLGDSVSWGDGIGDYRDCYPYLLERALGQADPGRTYEVINTGVPGYSTFQQAAYLKLRGQELQPDLIVLQFCLNDVVERYHSLAAYGGDNVFLGIDTRASLPGKYGFLVRHSRAIAELARFSQRRARRREEYEVENLARDRLSPELDEAWGLVFDELDDIRQTAETNDIPLMLVIAPYRFQLADWKRLRQPQDRLTAYAEKHGIMYVDLLPDFAGSVEKDRLFNDPSHFSLDGHIRAAELLLAPIRTLIMNRLIASETDEK